MQLARVPTEYVARWSWRYRQSPLIKCCHAATAAEFALLLPIIIGLSLGCIEIASMYITNLQVNALAIAVADNASRMEQANNSTVTPTVTTGDIESVMKGAILEGADLKISDKGRIILSSLEREPVTGKQYIHWQRCAGSLTVGSRYGNQFNLNGLNGIGITGMGAGATKVTALPNSAVMFVEVIYQYEGVFGTQFIQPFMMRSEAAFIVRDIRNLGTAGTNPITGNGSGWAC